MDQSRASGHRAKVGRIDAKGRDNRPGGHSSASGKVKERRNASLNCVDRAGQGKSTSAFQVTHKAALIAPHIARSNYLEQTFPPGGRNVPAARDGSTDQHSCRACPNKSGSQGRSAGISIDTKRL